MSNEPNDQEPVVQIHDETIYVEPSVAGGMLRDDRLFEKMQDDLAVYLPNDRPLDNYDRERASAVLQLQYLREIRDALRALSAFKTT